MLPFRPALYPPWLLPYPKVCKSILPSWKSSCPPEALRSDFVAHLESHSSALPIYTDGSKTSRATSFAVLFPTQSYQYCLPQAAGILTAELYALLKAVEHVHSHNHSSFVIFSDSLSALHLLQSTSFHPLKLQILEWLFEKEMSSVVLGCQSCWCPW